MNNQIEYNIEFPANLHAGIMRRIQLWRMRRSLFTAGFVIMCVSVISIAFAGRFVGSSFAENNASDAILTLMSGAEYNLSYAGYALDVLETVLPFEAIALALANLAVAASMGWILISFRKQVFKGRTFIQ